jgi:hypothetical protein
MIERRQLKEAGEEEQVILLTLSGTPFRKQGADSSRSERIDGGIWPLKRDSNMP